MNYSKIQKFLSSLLIFSLLFGITFRVPYFDYETHAGNTQFFNIVSIIVDEDSYDKILSELERYAKDIQAVLENTKVIILPTPKDTPAFNIASLNESLYFEGYKGLDKNVDFESKLIGTVIVGDFELPIAFDNNAYSRTIIPFTDFEDKVYIYNHETNRYEKNIENNDGLKSEIWHGVISPNLGSFEENINGLKDYFDKNHDFYSGTGNFKYSQGILNGNNSVGVPSIYEPYVFYYDQFREERALNYNNYQSYLGYIENKEDILYNRFNKELADKITDKTLGEATKTIKELIDKLDPNYVKDNVSNKPDTSRVPDVQTRFLIENVTKKFIEIFAKGTISDFRKDVNNAGRYNDVGGEVKVDMIPYIVTILDAVNDEIIKDVNNEVEKQIDDLVKNGLSRYIALPTRVNDASGCGKIFQNYIYGNKAETITSASQCSIYRGSNLNGGTLVEANRGLNINLTESDKDKLNSEPNSVSCLSNLNVGTNKPGPSLNGYWGGNSPLNLNINNIIEGNLVLKSFDYKGAIIPIFNIGGSKERNDSSKIYSPLNCYSNNYLLAQNSSTNDDGVCEVDYRLPTFGSRVNWSCTTDNNGLGKTYNYNKSFEENYKKPDGGIYLNGAKILGGGDLSFLYKKIPSFVEHKSPTSEELTQEINSMVTTSLPIDKDRYIDFVNSKGDYTKIDYPSLFRLKLQDNSKVSLEEISQALDKLLDEKSKEINELIKKSNPNTLTGKDLEIYNILKTGSYPNPNFDLKQILKDKEEKTLSVFGDSKKLSYYDTLVFSIFWNNLNSVSSKYGFVFDNYLIDQFGNQNDNYFLPKNKKEYEIAYLGAKGDAQNMYIKMDPEAKADNPYPEIFSQNITLGSTLLGSNIASGGENQEATFKCAPPDGVPIWEWIPAVMCWLGNLLPPSISISDGGCGPSLIEDGAIFMQGNFLSEEEKKEVLQCSGDVDKNGINDCIEKKLDDGILELTSDSKKYYYNKNASLKATIKDKDGKIVRIANSTDIYFTIDKIEAKKDNSLEFIPSNTKIVYDINDSTNDDISNIGKYVTFNEAKVRSTGGVSQYGIGLKSYDANVYVRAYIKVDDFDGNESIFLESDPLEIKVRGDRLFSSSYKLNSINEVGTTENALFSSSLKVSDKTNIFLVDATNNTLNSVSNVISNYSTSEEKLVILLENVSKEGLKSDINYPLTVNIFESGIPIIENINVTKNELNTFKPLLGLKKSGTYTIEVTDNNGFKTVKNIELLPDIANSIDINLGTTVMEAGGNVSTNFITIYDKYKNPVVGSFYDIDFSIDGEGINFLDNSSNNLKTTTFEGYKIFRLKSKDKTGNNTLNVSIFDDEGNQILKSSKNINVYDNINLVAKPISGDIKVGGGTYKYEVSLRDSNGNILNEFNSRVYLVADKIFLESVNNYVELKNGVAEIEFKTKNLAGKNIPIEFQVEGLKSIVQKTITIYPDVAMKIDLSLSQDKIEASPNAFSTLNIELKDRYNNLVFNDNETNIDLEILDQYSHIITSDEKKSIISDGKASFKIYGTVNPGVAYYKISTTPSLSSNTFTIKGGGEDIIVNGVGENAGKIETFYFWNDSKLDGKRYNSIYTTLLGSNYGDIYQQDYLAGSLLFERNNRSLAVTSQINNPYEYNNILELNNNGGIKTIYSKSDLSQGIEITPTFIDNKIGLNIYNEALNIYLGKVFYNFDADNKLYACDNSIESCINKEETSISLRSVSDKYKVYFADEKLIFRDIYGKNLFEIFQDGTINRLGSVEFEFNDNNYSQYLSINVKTGGQTIGELGFNFINPVISTSRDENIFDSKIDNTKNSILILLKTSSYGTYNNGKPDNQSKVFYYNDPFTSESKLNSFSKDNLYGIENFAKESGIGWKDGNKSLLAFSAGKSVGESVKDYMSFSVINLGDPVTSLKKIKKKLPKAEVDRKFDSTIGKLVSNDEDVLGYQVFDYNNDSKSDILLIKNDGNLKLIENGNINGNLLDMGNLAKIVDLGGVDLVHTGDFTGDAYDDIFFVNDDGKAFLLNNINKDFTRISLIENFDLSGRIVRAESFDMDNDGIDDIVTLDDFGELNVLYGGGTSQSPKFTKLKISDELGIKLNTDIRNDNGLVYFDSLYQPLDVKNDNSRIDNYLFIKYPYSFEDNIDYNEQDYIYGNSNFNNDRGNLYFLKSEYSEYSGLKVERKYKDKNGKFVSSDDIIEVEVTLTNVSSDDLYNVVYSEIVPDVFKLDKNSFESSDDFNIYDGESGYSYVIDNFDIPYGSFVTYSYELKVRPLKYNHLEVGLFENGEIGDDKYGDIILKNDNKNCSEPVEIYRSLDRKRSYEKGTSAPTCDENKIKLPSELEKNTIDEDGNGVPDYIDRLTNNMSDLKEYSNEKLNEMKKDSDKDGIPDDEDYFEMNGSITADLSLMSENIEKAIDDIDNEVYTLNCGFGSAGCFASPLNWAPLAPGNDPVFMGKMLLDDLNIDEGLPIFSSLTWNQYGPFCLPSTWPSSPLSTGCSGLGAGGILGIKNVTNVLRIFVTPTLTGGVGTAICFGGPANIVGNIPPYGLLSPLFPGGNCVVIAKKTFGCSGDGSDGDPASTGFPSYSLNGNFGIINGNCPPEEEKINSLSKEKISNYLEKTKKGPVEQAFDFLPGDFSETPFTPLFSQGGESDISVNFDLAAAIDGNFEDIIKINMKRVSPFPSWLMDWVTRQIEEIANKLTDFPTLFVILPDFTGILDGNWGEESGNKARVSADAISIDNNLTGNETVDNYARKVNSGIKEAYEFIGSLPLVYLDQETVNITLPWISEAEINKTLTSRGDTVDQREKEVTEAKEAWTFGEACNYSDPVQQRNCEEHNNLASKAGVQFLAEADGLISSLRANIDVVKSYKGIPEKINKLINKKQDYLEQILCNIDIISYILGGRIGKNGERFKAWVELYILIKAILKSWQALVDVFLDYEAECHDCKNERQDALEEEFSLIDLIVPKIPIIRFPKWPDIILDLHNIRAGLRITLPEYNINSKPIILPSLPLLQLPKVPSINLSASIQLPEIPVLPTIDIPTLPDLPTLPKVELPDLPPPPKLPKLLASIEVIVDIIKLITKVMCILKNSPIHPEKRAGDQIAFLTERTGYLGFDFFELTMPEFSFPFVDAIKVSSYVNLEFEADFIVELSRQIAMPINAFSNDFTNIFDVKLGNLDFRNVADDIIPSNIDVNVGPEGINNDFGLNNSSKFALLLAKRVGTNLEQLTKVLDDGKDVEVDNLEFRKLVNESLASETITSNPRLDRVRNIWEQVNNYTYSNENKLIKELQDSNTQKFEAIKDIVNTEIIKNKELKKQLNSIGKGPIVKKVGFSEENKIDTYNKTIEKYNNKFIQAAKNLVDGKGDDIKKDLKETGDELLSSIKTPLENYSKRVSDNSLLSAVTGGSGSNTTSTTINSCQAQASSPYKYNYKGLYVLEGNTSYRLFDYLDELNGNEETTIIDIDGDDDDDLLYFANNQLFIKENLKNEPIKIYVSANPIVLDSKDNKFYNGDTFYESINNFGEIGLNNGNIVLGFSEPTNKSINNYRIGLYGLIDKYLNEDNENYRPEFIRKDIIDAVSDIDNSTKTSENELYIERKNLAYIDNIGNFKGLKLYASELKNIKDDLESNTIVNILKGTQIFAGGDSFTIKYLYTENDENIKTLNISSHENIEFYRDIKIIGISGDAFIKGDKDIVYLGNEIRKYIDKPLFPGAKIVYDLANNELLDQTYVDLKYYDDSELGLDFSETSSWELFDLGYKTSDYYIRINKNNDFYYSKINSFSNNIESTLSKQVLLAPQKEADNTAPELSIPFIKVPIYQKTLIDLTSYIYEDSGISNVKDIIVDMDLEIDSDGNGNTKDDNDGYLDGVYKDKVKILVSEIFTKLQLGAFDHIFKKKIGITLIDTNGNVGFKEVVLDVYSPTPQVKDFSDGLVNGEINEKLSNEPINLFRYRGGQVSNLEDIDGLKTSTTENGKYDFNISMSGSGLNLYRDSEEIAFIDETTGKITFKDYSLRTRVLSSTNNLNDSAYPKIIISDSGQDIFYEYLKIDGVTKVDVVDSFSEINNKGIYFTLTDKLHYNYYSTPESLSYNPGALSIYRLTDVNKSGLFTIFNDGRINTINEFYDLVYVANEQSWYFKLIDTRFNREVGRLMFVPNAEYIMK